MHEVDIGSRLYGENASTAPRVRTDTSGNARAAEAIAPPNCFCALLKWPRMGRSALRAKSDALSLRLDCGRMWKRADKRGMNGA